MNVLFILVLVLTKEFSPVLTSEGDRSPFYQNCNKSCMAENCTKDGDSFAKQAIVHQEYWSKLLRWSCRDECRYHCMWKTVEGYSERGFSVPKFHGKWPFKRIMGVQEPASAFSSALNLAAHLYMYIQMKREISAESMPILEFWLAFSKVCMHAWAWSTIFHTRDTLMTEFMDYACALSMVLALFVAAVVRILHKRRKLTLVLLLISLLYYVNHLRYLYSGAVDYEYNMAININIGTLGSAIWLTWSLYHYIGGKYYTWRMVVFVLLSAIFVLFEVFDFPPIYDLWDAHALWHLSTAPLPFLFYRFVIDDLRHLQEEQFEKLL